MDLRGVIARARILFLQETGLELDGFVGSRGHLNGSGFQRPGLVGLLRCLYFQHGCYLYCWIDVILSGCRW